MPAVAANPVAGIGLVFLTRTFAMEQDIAQMGPMSYLNSAEVSIQYEG